jgi:hypothetical protein
VLIMVAIAQSKPVAPAVYVGRQDGAGIFDDFDLYNLTADIPGHPEGSTVSAETLERAGYRLPLDIRASSAGVSADAPAPLPTAAQCPPMLCVLEVVRHPAGGYTHATPIDATQSSVRIYRGWWSSRRAAAAALENLFRAHVGNYPIAK